MKKLTRILSAAVAAIMGLCVFAFAACGDDTEVTETSSSSAESSTATNNNNTTGGNAERVLKTLAISTLSDIYSSTTGYEISADAGITIDKDGNTVTVNADGTLKTKNDGTYFNADAEGSYSMTDAAGGTSSSYFGKGYVRGTDIYYTYSSGIKDDLTAEDIANLTYTHYDLSAYTTESIDVASIVTSASYIVYMLLEDGAGTVTSTSEGYTLAYSDNVLLTPVSNLNIIVSAIALSAKSQSSATIGEYLESSDVKNAIDSYLGSYSGKDIYDLINTVASLTQTDISAYNISEGTEDQTAYEYIIELAGSIVITGENGSDYLINMTLSDTNVLNYITKAAEITSAAYTLVANASVEFELVFNTYYTLTDITITAKDLVYNGYDTDADIEIVIENKEVTLDDITDIIV